jgi:hypothetical protein
MRALMDRVDVQPGAAGTRVVLSRRLGAAPAATKGGRRPARRRRSAVT